MRTKTELIKTPLKLEAKARAKALRLGFDPKSYRFANVKNALLLSRQGVAQSIYEVRSKRQDRQYKHDVLTSPIVEREKTRGFQLLRKLGKDRPGEMVTFELECFLPQGKRQELKSLLPLAVEMVGDGSLRSEVSKKTTGMEGIELRVPCSITNYSRLYKVGALLASFGAKVNTSCGMHVHFDVRDLSPGKEWRNVKAVGTRLYDVVSNVLRYLVPPSRMGNTYCALTPPSINDRYRCVNAEAVSKHGTLEVRLAAGTVEPDKARLWAETCLFFLRSPMSKEAKARLVNVRDASTALDWLMRSDLPPTLKWWAAQRVEKFHPNALVKPADGANASEGSE